MANRKRIGILGSGDVGRSLGAGLARHGHEVKLGSRSPESDKLSSWLDEVEGNASTGTLDEAAAFGDVVILAVNGSAAEEAVDRAGVDAFAGKVVIDAMNPLAFAGDGPPGLFVGTTDSLGERVQRKLPEARVVKAFNTVSHVKMVDPSFEQGSPPMLICGDDAQAKAQVEALLKDLGWPGALDVGGIDGARWLEALVPLWVRAGSTLDTWGHVFAPVT